MRVVVVVGGGVVVVGAGFGFVVYRERDGDPFGVARKILVPMGTGTPRILQ